MKKANFMNQVPVKNVKRNLFDLSHEVKMSGKMGYLYPILCLEGLPGDTIRDQMTAMVRFAPLLSPVMHSMDVKTDFFFVPARILSDSWEEFITGGQNGDLEPVLPYTTVANLVATGREDFLNKGSLWDYFGLPIAGIQNPSPPTNYSALPISLLPFRAYTKIFNDYFRDPNLDDEIDLETELDGLVPQVADGYMAIRRRGWDRGYFTNALPFAQRGPAVLMPFDAEVTYRDRTLLINANTDAPLTGHTTASGAGDPWATENVGVPGGILFGGIPTNIENIESISSSNITINDLRRSMAIQSWLENNARGGARYNEQILSHFNTRVPDYRLQRAEYLGGGRQPVVISEVLSTADTETVPVGDMAGHGISVGKSNRFTYHCQEHGFVIGIMSIVPKPSYAAQGIHRMWTRTSKFDYAWPELANLGEQEVLSRELYYSFNLDDEADNNSVFGYLPRYAEYKVIEDRLAGDFRDTLAHWHEARMFNIRPTLSATFQRMVENPPSGEATYRRIFAVQDGTDYLWIQLFHRLTAKRPLPYFGVPMLNG